MIWWQIATKYIYIYMRLYVLVYMHMCIYTIYLVHLPYQDITYDVVVYEVEVHCLNFH